MLLFVGLGNIGREYINTRHNIGFFILDKYAKEMNVEWVPGKGDYILSIFEEKNKEIMLLKPTTYMNNSGLAVSDVVEKYDIKLSDMLVICDDINLPLGAIRIRPKGSDGGHNGLASIIYHLMSDEFPRLRVGIGYPPQNLTLSEYVLSEFNEQEKLTIDAAVDRAISAIKFLIENDLNKTMTIFNSESKYNPN